MSTGHHAFEADYDRPADVVPDPHGHDAAEAIDPDYALVLALRRDEKEQRKRFAMYRLLFNEPHPDVCPTCKGSQGAFPKCLDCKRTGAKSGTPMRAIQNDLQSLRDRGVSTYLRQGEVL